MKYFNLLIKANKLVFFDLSRQQICFFIDAEIGVIEQFYFSNNLLGLRHNLNYFLKCSQWVELHME